MLWAEGKTQTHIMEHTNNNHHFNLKQREMFARLLQEAKKQAETDLPSESELNSQVEAEFTPKIAKEQGVSEMVEKWQKLHREAKEAEEVLEHLGFSCDSDGEISIKYDAPKPLRNALKAAQREAQKERTAQLRKYDRAVLKVWAAQSPEEAQKIVEDLL